MASYPSEIKDLYEKLCEMGCCKMCTLRFIGETERQAFIEAQKTLVQKGLEENESTCKIKKNNPCIACLGLLEQNTITDTINKICEVAAKENYDSKTFNLTMTLPVSFQIRAHSMWIYLKKTFPEFCRAAFSLGLVSVNVKDVWKYIAGHQIEEAISKRCETSSDFIIAVSFHYSDDNSELNSLAEMGHQMPKGGRRHRNTQVYSRKSVETFLNSVSEEKFMQHFSSPPKIPAKSVHCEYVSLQQNSIHIAGRYNKLTRHLPQTPWLIDGERRVENSIQEIISGPLMELTKSKTPKFSASGREDVDVRTLGRGRPFSVEFLDPRRTIFSFQEMRDVEKKINSEGFGKVAVRDLQLVDKESLKELKEGEEFKKKSYCAYCVVIGPLPEGLDKLQTLVPLTLAQKTPIRVLHRRPFAVRPRIIHKMKAVPHISTSDPNGQSFFKLYIDTQAGTYIKEFVHGDFGRTKPSLGDLLDGVKVDIMALDVQNVLVDWPPEINYDNEDK